jgi:ABC-type glutathione transport system ATPase component
MRLRLSVALALCGRPSIVLIDDVLAVGDIAFQQKVVDRIHELKEAGCTLILALSDDALVRQLATRVIGLAAGRVVSDTTPAHWADAREAHGMGSSEWQITDALPEDDVMSLAAIDVARADQTPAGAASAPGEAGMLDLSLTFDAKAGGLRCRPSVFIARGKTVLFRSVAPAFIDVASPRRFTWQVRLPVHMLTPGRHAVLVNMQTIRGDLVYAMKAPDAVGLVIDGNGDSTVERGTPLMRVDVPWEIESLEGAAQPA